MATLKSNITSVSPNIYSTATITQSSRSGTSVKLNISLATHLRYAESWLGTGCVLTGRVVAYGVTKNITIKASSASWSGNKDKTVTATMSITVPANITSINLSYQLRESGSETANGNTATGTLTLSKVLATATSATAFSDTTNPTIQFSNPGNFALYPYINLWTQQNNGTQIGTVIRPSGMSSSGAKISSPYTWNLTTAQRNQIRDWMGSRSSAYATVGINTMSGTTSLGSSSKGVTFTNVLQPPTFTDFAYADINSNTLAITNSNQEIVKGYSTLQVLIDTNNKAVANKGATMSYYLINGEKVTYSDTESIIKTFEKWSNETNAIEVRAVDSRGLTTSKTLQLTIANYTPLQSGFISLSRDGNISEETKLSYSGSGKYLLPNNTPNTIIAVYQYKKTSDDTYINGKTNITPELSNNDTFNFPFGNNEGYIEGDIENGGFSIDDSFNIVITVSDVLSSVQYTYTLNSGIPAVSIKGNNIALHGMYNEQDDANIQLHGKVSLNGITMLEDTGWVDLPLLNGVTARDNTIKWKPQLRRIGNIVYCKGQVSIPAHTSNIAIAEIPEGFRPQYELRFEELAQRNNWYAPDTYLINVSADNTARSNEGLTKVWVVN